MSRPVQQEVEGICWNAKCHSLDVGRKHNQDKASEGRRVISVSAASRNSILQRYRLQRSKVIAESIKDRRRAAKDIYMNTRAIAIAERPDLFKRGTGKLWWQSARSQAERQIISHAGDETALQAYINEHSQRLTAKMQALHARARRVLHSAPGRTPFTNAEWLEWFGEHDTEFRALLKTAPTMRRAVRDRLVALTPLPEAPRIYPKAVRGVTHDWGKKMFLEKRGFFWLVAPPTRKHVTVFGCRCRNGFWAFPFDRIGDMVITFNHEVLLTETCKPVRELLEDKGFNEADLRSDIQVLSLTLADPVVTDRGVRFCVRSAVPVELRQGNAAKEEADDNVEFDLEEEWLKPFDSDQVSLCSEEETGADEVQEEVADDELDEASDVDGDAHELADTRAPAGTFVVYRSDYSYITDNPKYPDVRLDIHNRWLAELGTGQGQKQVTKAHYDTASPVLSCLVLRAWFLQRSRGNGWVEKKLARSRWALREVEALKR